MSQKYQPPKETGREYVDATKTFHAYSIHILMKLPKRWGKYLLDPVFQISENIENLIIRANKIYINPKSMSPVELSNAYHQRISLLQEALREFSVFDQKFETLFLSVDLLKDESKRLKTLMSNIIYDEINREITNTLQDSTSKQAVQNGTFTPKFEFELSQKRRLDEIEYTTSIGSKSMKLGVTSKHKDHWIELELKAEAFIRKRIEKDTFLLKSIKALK